MHSKNTFSEKENQRLIEALYNDDFNYLEEIVEHIGTEKTLRQVY